MPLCASVLLRNPSLRIFKTGNLKSACHTTRAAQVHVRVRIPKQLAPDERKLVEELRELQSKTKVGPFRF